MENTYDVIIIGSGPAGLTAAIYNTRANLKTLVLAGRKWGGQLMLTTEVENFPGFPEGIMGPQLMMNMRKQAEHHGATVVDENFKSIDYSKKPFEITTDDEKKFYTKSVIIATGADTKWLQVPGEMEKIGRGVSSCAPCDAAFYREKKVIVVGGGDSAMEEALVLTRFASHVYLLHRRDSFKASDIMQKRVFENPKITVLFNTEITEILGEQKVERVKIATTGSLLTRKQESNTEVSIEDFGTVLERKDTKTSWEMAIDGVFVAIGHIPNSTVFQGIDTDEKGFIKQYPDSKTNIEGVFVAGDVHDHIYKQAITAAGYGCQAALDVEKWLMEKTQ